MYDWTEDLKRFGESRNWIGLPRRHALKQFRESFCPAAPEGFHVADAFTFGYQALARATLEQRADCHTYADVKTLQKEQEHADQERCRWHAEQQANARAVKYQELRAAVDAGRHCFVWPQGLWVEDVSCGKQANSREEFDSLVLICREKCERVNNRLGVEECCVMAALVDERGLFVDDGIRIS